VPDGALSEDLVLGEGDELAQDSRGELGGEDGIGGTIAGEGPARRLTDGDPFGSGRAVAAQALDWPAFWAWAASPTPPEWLCSRRQLHHRRWPDRLRAWAPQDRGVYDPSRPVRHDRRLQLCLQAGGLDGPSQTT
jgi:hypothetical protein